MIRETYKGREIVTTRKKGYDGTWVIKINGNVCATGSHSEPDGLAWVKETIDAVDAAPKGESRYGAEWYTPGTFEINDNGHVVEIGGVCSCHHCAPVTAATPAPRPAAAGNVTITLPAEYARKALDQLRAVREDAAVRDVTTAVHVLVRRLEDALAERLAPAPAVDYTDPVETVDGPRGRR